MEGTGIVEKFIQLAGGPDKKFIIVPTAGGNKNGDGSVRPYDETQIIASWVKRGLKNVRMLHTHDPKVADTEAFVKNVKDADAVWFNGGRQWNIVDSYANTRTFAEFHKVLERGGVIGGSSAGATIQGRLPGARRYFGTERHDDRGAEPSGGLQVPAPVGDRSAHQRPQSLGRPRSPSSRSIRTCSASACQKARRSS